MMLVLPDLLLMIFCCAECPRRGKHMYAGLELHDQ